MKVVRFLDKQQYQPPEATAPAEVTGWNWSQRYGAICAGALGLTLLLAVVALTFMDRTTGAGSFLYLIGLFVALFGGALFQWVLGRRLLLARLERAAESVIRAAGARTALSTDSLRQEAGAIGARTALAVNRLIHVARAETAPAPLSAYREAFLLGSQPAYIGDFTSGRFLDCNHAFADFIGLDRESLLRLRLGDVTVCGTGTPDESPATSLENGPSPVMELTFRHGSGQILRAVTFLHPVSDPSQTAQAVHCAVVVPQPSVAAPTS